MNAPRNVEGKDKTMLTIERNNMNYKPWFPHGKLIRTRGHVNQTAYVIIWLWIIINIEL